MADKTDSTGGKDAAVLTQDQPCRLTPSKAGLAIAKRLNRVDSSGNTKAYSPQAVRNWIREGSGFPAVPANPEDPACDRFVVTNVAAAAEWVRVNKPETGHGGTREGAGRKPANPKSGPRESQPDHVDTSAAVDEFDDSYEGDETTPAGSGNGHAGAAAETGLSRARTRKVFHEAGIARLKHQQMLGVLIDRNHAVEGYERVMGAVVRRLERLPQLAVDRAADRMDLASAERDLLLNLLTESVDEIRGEIVRDPLGVDGDEREGAAA